MEKIFLSGGTGFIGSHFINHAHRCGYELHCLRRPHSKPCIPLDKEPFWHDGFLDDDWCFVLNNCDYFVHFAASGVNPSESNYEDLIKTNILDATKLTLSAVTSGIQKIIILGSYWEYGNTAKLFDYIPNDACLQPTNRYASSKAAFSLLACQIAVEYKIQLQYLRVGNCFGEGESVDRLWPSLRKAAARGDDYHLTLGEQVRDFSSVETVVDKVLDALNFDSVQNGAPKILNIGSGRPQTVRQFVEYWWNQWGAKGKLHFGSIPYRRNEIMRYVPKIEAPE